MLEVIMESMQLVVEGGGIVCTVFFIDSMKFEEICDEASLTQVGLGDLIEKDASTDKHIVSKGYFLDRESTELYLKLGNGSRFTKQDIFNLGKQRLVLEMGDMDSEDILWHEVMESIASIDFPGGRSPDIGQVAIVYYEEFQHGISKTEFTVAKKMELENIRFWCANNDCDDDFVKVSTYYETIVGSEEYDHAEIALLGMDIDGKNMPIELPIYEEYRSRAWVYSYDEAEDQFVMDYLQSKRLPEWKKGRAVGGVPLIQVI
tara:strand:+ start:72 stop:854 length:783 start_codon:yes stop_codon:yes gene_type:complete